MSRISLHLEQQLLQGATCRQNRPFIRSFPHNLLLDISQNTGI